MSEITRKKILDSAKKEFSKYGFSGARIDRIAKSAGVNKAMLFYYFSSKENLYKQILKDSAEKLIERIKTLIKPELTAKEFFEKMPEIYISYFSKNIEIIKILGWELLSNNNFYKNIIKDILTEKNKRPQMLLKKLITKWIKNNEINEYDPLNFLLNVISLSLFSFIGKEMAETILDYEIKEDENFYQKRAKSITNLLKRGMLK